MKNGRRQRSLSATALRYVGAGAALIGVPARDLSEAEVVNYDMMTLLASQLYAAPTTESSVDAVDAVDTKEHE